MYIVLMIKVQPSCFLSSVQHNRLGYGKTLHVVPDGIVCMYDHTYGKSMDRPGRVANSARGQLNREN